MSPNQEFLFEIAESATLVSPVEATSPIAEGSPGIDWERHTERPLVPEHRQALEAALDRYDEQLGRMTLSSTYYRYRGLSHTVRIRRDRLLVRISHHFESEDPRVIEALGHILFRKLLRRRRLEKEWEIAREAERRIEAKLEERPEETAPSRISDRHWSPPKGEVHDLEEMARSLSARFFGSEFPNLPLFWTAKIVKGYWGKYFEDPPRIVLNRALDKKKVPGFVVEAVLYHEMLHHRLGVEKVNGRRRIHTREFRIEESKFPRLKEAERFLLEFRARRSPRRRNLIEWIDRKIQRQNI